MPVGCAHATIQRVLVRRVKTVRGDLASKSVRPALRLRTAPHTVEARRAARRSSAHGPDGSAVRHRTAVPMTVDGNDAVVSSSTLPTGESAAFVLEEAAAQSPSPSPPPTSWSRAFKDTVNFWRRWIGRSTYQGRWREMVNRSALALKLLLSQRHGSIVAAPTFGLPEQLGGERNWDYRYTWIRDASFTLYALIRLGYTDEARAFMRLDRRRAAWSSTPDGSLQIMYGIDGRTTLTERRSRHLAGTRGSRPVRIGNGAYDQLQLDIYGELMDAVYLYNKYGEPISYDLWTDLVRLIDWVCEHWQLARTRASGRCAAAARSSSTRG